MTTRKALLWIITGQIALLSFQLAGQIILTRILSPYEMGVYAAALATTSLISLGQIFGLNSLIVREPELSEQLRDTAFTINLVIGVLIAGAIGTLSFVLSAWYHDNSVARVLRVLALVPLIGTLELIPSASLQRTMEFRVISLIMSARAIANTSCAVLLAFLGASFMSFAWAALISATLSAALFNIYGRKHSTFKLGLYNWHYVVKYGLEITSISGVIQISSRMSVLILGKVLGLNALGYYSRAENIIALLWDNLHSVLARVLISDLAKQKREGLGSIRASYLKIVSIMTAILWPAFAGIAVLAGPIVHLVYGTRWDASAGPLALLSISLLIFSTTTLAWEIFIVCKETHTQAKLEIFRAFFSLATFSFFCNFGIIAAAIARILDAMLSQLLYLPKIMTMTATDSADLAPIYSKNMMLTLIAVGPAILMMAYYRWTNIPPLFSLLSSVWIGIILWSIGLKVINHPLYIECRLAVEKVLRS